MKWAKFVPTLATTLVLAACSTAENVASGTVDAVKDAATATTDAVKGAATVTGDAVKGAATATTDAVKGAVNTTKEAVMTKTRTIAYRCNTGDVVVSYAFYNDEVKGATVRLGKNTEITGFVPNTELTAKVASPVFVSGDYVLTSDSGLSLAKATQTNLVMLTKTGKASDEILAKHCKINTAATKKLN